MLGVALGAAIFNVEDLAGGRGGGGLETIPWRNPARASEMRVQLNVSEISEIPVKLKYVKGKLNASEIPEIPVKWNQPKEATTRGVG